MQNQRVEDAALKLWHDEKMPSFQSQLLMIYHLLRRLKHHILTLRFSILFIFIPLFISTSLLIITITSIRFSHTLSSAATQLMEYASSAVLRELTMGIEPAEVQGKFAAHLIEKNILKTKNSREETISNLVPYTYYLIKTMPLVVSAYWGNEKGDYVYSKKETNGTISTDIYTLKTRTTLLRNKKGEVINRIETSNFTYNYQVRPWYIEAKEQKRTLWTDIYFFESIPERGITTATPTFVNGTFDGVFGIDINLAYLSNFMTHQQITPNGFSFIVTKDGRLVAYPKIKHFTDLNVPSNQFINVHMDSLPVISGSFDQYQKSGQKKSTFRYNYNGKFYLITYEPVTDLAAYGWLVGVVVPESDFTNDLDQMNIITSIISFIALILGIALVSGLITKIVNPIKSLVKETENIKNFDLEGEIIIHSRIKEVLYLKDAVHAMKVGLKLFQRYIPKTLVRQLIESDGDIKLGGSRKKLAILFSDIENFTSIAEQTAPNLLMTQLCEYFEELSSIISKEAGTIDKYIGDSIMAFWGAPLPDAESCHHAAYAAVLCQEKLVELNAQWKKQGRPQFITRIGIHTGEAIVGNLGSSERLNYTALGDTINIASRLEGINKNYKTNIIVSDEVYEQIKDRFILRMIDCVIVKGRTKSSCLYELLGDDRTKITFDLNAYRAQFKEGFMHYQKQQWDEAIASFHHCIKIYPTDTIAPIFIGRCNQYKLIPPGSDWKGITAWDLGQIS